LSAQPVPKQIIIPTAAASWFDASKVHEIEKVSLPHFFEHEGDNSYEQEYIRYRDYMINTYQADSTEYLTVLACTKDLNGDLEDLMRIHSFLELWGLINYQVCVEGMVWHKEHLNEIVS
jgi:SWIRM domain